MTSVWQCAPRECSATSRASGSPTLPTQELAGDDAVELAVEGVETVVQTGPTKLLYQHSFPAAMSSR